MYGLALPQLFPIALLSYFIIYCTERYQIAYTYQLPPAMDDKMTVNALNLLSWTPFVFLLNGYWMLSNRQMFENVVNQLQYSTQQMQSDHSLHDMFKLTISTPMLVLIVVMGIIIVLRRCAE